MLTVCIPTGDGMNSGYQRTDYFLIYFVSRRILFVVGVDGFSDEGSIS
jgi:hypothetical protein